MVELRQQKVDIIANDLPQAKPYGKNKGDLLVLGWGGTHGAIRSAVESAQNEGYAVSHLHLRYLNPLPKNIGDILVKFQKILIPELNLGQLAMLIRSKFLIDAISLSKVQGKPFNKNEILSSPYIKADILSSSLSGGPGPGAGRGATRRSLTLEAAP